MPFYTLEHIQQYTTIYCSENLTLARLRRARGDPEGRREREGRKIAVARDAKDEILSIERPMHQ